ncbi:MAG TPA: hypothetical protein VFN75_03485 [Pseudonocardiaceae bacterium]|nr:hypothetical protein [Pseudonocardiaceae bacterium]
MRTVNCPREPVEQLLDGDGHGEAGGSDTDAGPTAIADNGHSGFGQALNEVAGEVAMAGIPNPLTVRVIKTGPPLMGKLQGRTHRVTTFWVVVIEIGGRNSQGCGCQLTCESSLAVRGHTGTNAA